MGKPPGQVPWIGVQVPMGPAVVVDVVVDVDPPSGGAEKRIVFI